MELEGNFQKFASNIEPTENHREEAISGHETLRKRMEEDKEISPILLETFLSGSYKRHTAVKPIKDVDVIVVLSNEIGSARGTLQWLEKKLNKVGYKAKTTPQRRSIRIDLSLITMDVVPALAPNGLDQELEVPAREENIWIKSSPNKHLEDTSALNKKSQGERFIPIVKMAKWWRNFKLPQAKHPKGFYLEVLSGEHMDFFADCYAKAFLSILKSLSNTFGKKTISVPQLQDPGLPGQSIVSGITDQEFRLFIEKVNESLPIAQKAFDADNKGESISLWREIFGPEFPDSEGGDDKGSKGTPGPTVLRRSPRDVREAPPFANKR